MQSSFARNQNPCLLNFFIQLLHVSCSPVHLRNPDCVHVYTVLEPTFLFRYFHVVAGHLALTHPSVVCECPVLQSIASPPLPRGVVMFVPELHKAEQQFCDSSRRTIPSSVCTLAPFPTCLSEIPRSRPSRGGSSPGYARPYPWCMLSILPLDPECSKGFERPLPCFGRFLR